jgi:putative methyltransferase
LQITALEQSAERYKTLVSQLTRAGSLRHDTAGAVKAIQCDFTKQSEKDYVDVTHMLLDPSCSGSGILSRLDYLISEEAPEDQDSKDKEQERLRNLSAFQSSMIDHAMQFPSLRRIVYSTCSVHHEENEEVVVRALESPIAKSRGWKLAPRSQVIPSWSTRGLIEHCEGKADLAESMIRCVPGGMHSESQEQEAEAANLVDMNATNGFFLACFERSPNTNAKNKKRNKRAREKAKEGKRARIEKSEEVDDD